MGRGYLVNIANSEAAILGRQRAVARVERRRHGVQWPGTSGSGVGVGLVRVDATARCLSLHEFPGRCSWKLVASVECNAVPAEVVGRELTI